jgi:uncharacterized protein DUF4864
MARLILALCLLLGVTAARAEDLAPADRAAIAGVISDQIAAFRVDDAARAFAYASPAIQAKFGTAERFLEMVRSGYAPVYQAEDLAFGEIAVENGVPVQAVEIHTLDGEGVLALYFMERQPDGSWRINGVVMTALPERTA